MKKGTGKIIDSHVHIFPSIHGISRYGAITGLGHGWVSRGERREKLLPNLVGEDSCFTVDQLLILVRQAGVDRAVLLQGPFYGECNAYALTAVREYPENFTAQAYFDPWKANWRESFQTILNEPAFRGIKIEFSVETGFSGIYPGCKLNETQLNEVWGSLERAKRVLTLDLGTVGSASYQTASVAEIARRFPELVIVISHLAQPEPKLLSDNEQMKMWLDQIELGRLSNVFFDTASLPMVFREQKHPFPLVHEFLHRAVDVIGPIKILWGSDAPGTLTLVSYNEYINLARQHLDFLSAEEQALILGENAHRIYFAERGG
jgi:predicted TIM-barrel fold metal-dependent hydrolase